MTTTPMTPANGSQKAGSSAQSSSPAGEGGREKLKHLQEQAHDKIEQTRQTAHEVIDKAGRSLMQARGMLTEQVQERPMATAAVAAGVGLVLGLLLAPRGRR